MTAARTKFGLYVLSALVLLGLFAAFALVPVQAQSDEETRRVAVNPTADVIDLRGQVRELTIRPRLNRFSEMAAPLYDEEVAEDIGISNPPPADLGAGLWFVVGLENQADGPITRTLVLHNPTLAGAGISGVGRAGMRVRNGVRWTDGAPAENLTPADSRNTVVSYHVTLEPYETTYVALLVEGDVTPYSLALWEPNAFQRLERLIAAGKGILFGALLVLAALVAGRWVLEGREEDLAATAFVGSAVLFLATALGAHYGLTPAHSSIAGAMKAAALYFFAASGLFFLRQRLPLERLQPTLPGNIAWVSLIGAGLGILSLLRLGIETGAGLFAGLAALGGAALTFIMVRRGEYRAPAMLPGAMFLLLCVLASAALSFLAPSPFTGLQTLMLSGAIAAGTGLLALAAALSRQGLTGLQELDLPVTRMGFGREAQMSSETKKAPKVPAALTAPSDPAAERALLALDTAREGLWDYDVLTEHLYVSPAVEGMIGLPLGSLTGKHEVWCGRLHQEDLPHYYGAIATAAESGASPLDIEFRMRRKDGSFRWLHLKGAALPSDEGRASRMVGVVRDVTNQRTASDHEKLDGLHDILTGLANRTLLIERLSDAADAARNPEDAPPALMVIDIDRFKLINEGLGHSGGDTVLVTIARRLESLIGPDDTVARIGSDEFAVLLRHGIGDEGFENAADIVIEHISAPITIDGIEMTPSVSIGMSDARLSSEGGASMLRDSEAALCNAKQGGEGLAKVFTGDMRASSAERLSLETDLRRGLAQGQIVLLYQPIMNLRNGRLTGFEGLVRWRHPERGDLTPEQFMPIAQEIGLLEKVTLALVEQVVGQLRAWQVMTPSKTPVFISLDLASPKLVSRGFAESVRDLVKRANLARGTLRFEIAASVVGTLSDEMRDVVAEYEALGIGICLDDFGTGPAGLQVLTQLPCDCLKMGRPFLRGEGGAPQVILQSMITLARELRKTVIAVGAETEEDVRALRSVGCEYAQGTLFGGPMTSEAADAMAAKAQEAKPAQASAKSG